MLSDSEQRALAEIERSLAAEDPERVPGLVSFLWSHWAQLSDCGEPLPSVADRPARARPGRYFHRYFTHLLRMAEAE